MHCGLPLAAGRDIHPGRPCNRNGRWPRNARESKILDRLSKGYRSKEIGDALGISTLTMNTHLRNIYEKLHVRSRAEAVAHFLDPSRPVPELEVRRRRPQVRGGVTSADS